MVPRLSSLLATTSFSPAGIALKAIGSHTSWRGTCWWCVHLVSKPARKVIRHHYIDTVMTLSDVLINSTTTTVTFILGACDVEFGFYGNMHRWGCLRNFCLRSIVTHFDWTRLWASFIYESHTSFHFSWKWFLRFLSVRISLSWRKTVFQLCFNTFAHWYGLPPIAKCHPIGRVFDFHGLHLVFMTEVDASHVLLRVSPGLVLDSLQFADPVVLVVECDIQVGGHHNGIDSVGENVVTS